MTIIAIRHSERFDLKFPDKWKESQRYKENIYDTPLSENGYLFAKEKFLDIFENNKELNENNKEPNNKELFLYSSPMTRCVETCRVIQDIIFQKTGILCKIRIEPGLTFYVEGKLDDLKCDGNVVYKNGKFQLVKRLRNKQKILDKKLQLTSDNYSDEKFDLNYKPIVSANKINRFRGESILDNINIRIDTIKKLIHKHNDTLALIVTHAECLDIYKSMIDNKFAPTNRKLFTKEYMSSLKIIS